jgi:cytochrome c oxidase subunit 2
VALSPIPPALGLLRWDLPVDAAAHGPALDRQLLLNLWIFLALLVLAHLVLVAGLILRRRAQEPREPSARRAILTEYLPLAVLAILFATLTVRAERLWATARYTGADPAALQVQVTGVQFAWYFRYPGQDATFGRTDPHLIAPGEGNPLGINPADPRGKDDLISAQLILPANREVDLRINSQDVIHGFFVPELRLKQNAVPGQTIHLHFTPTIPGTYAILCSQLCGMGHYRMQADLRVLPPAKFAAWLAAKETAKENQEKAAAQ